MRSLMLRSIWAVGKCFDAIDELANVRTLSSVGSLMDFKIFQSRERLRASGELQETNFVFN